MASQTVIPIYIGISRRFDCAKGVTARSIIENTSANISITYLYPEIESGCTGFTNVRYSIRKGVYLDVDMIVTGDIAQLWSYKVSGKWVCMEDGSTEVSVIDCEHSCTNKHEEHLLPKLPIIPKEWNVKDAFRENGKVKFLNNVPDNTKLFHFTALDHQPWFYEHPNREAVKLYERYKPDTTG